MRKKTDVKGALVCFAVAAMVGLVVMAAPAVRGDVLGPVSFSVNGPVDPHYDGLWPPGALMFLPPWAPPPTPVGAGPFPPIRLPAVPQATGVPTVRPGDVNDYAAAGFASEAEIFQSEPDHAPAGPPAGTNNQILKAVALGLVGQGPTLGGANVNALSFGDDYFNGDEEPIGGYPVELAPWDQRMPGPAFTEPVVAGGGSPITFAFSVDPWAIGLANTAVQGEATLNGLLTLPAGPPGSADVDSTWPPGGLGPWSSGGEAAGDVFEASPITFPGTNRLDHEESTMALAPWMSVDPGMEDDLDALEHGGRFDPTGLWEAGNCHDWVTPTMGGNGGWHPPDLADPTNPNHDPMNEHPVIFSVDRGTYGAPGSAVAAQVMSPVEGACGDLFIAVAIPTLTGIPVTTNMLLIDEGQLGLMPHDDLDAVIVRLLIPIEELVWRIQDAAPNYNPESEEGSVGYGFTVPLLGQREAAIGFSVDTASIGLVFTAVDFECRVDGLGMMGGSGLMEQSGDIFFANLVPSAAQQAADPGTGLLYAPNYLWFEEVRLGLDPGAWTFMVQPSGNLADLPDELDALDSRGLWASCNPDLDFDGDVNGFDFLTFSNCYNGSNRPPLPACQNLNADLDADGDVDGFDFLTFSNCYNGSNRPPLPTCPCLTGS